MQLSVFRLGSLGTMHGPYMYARWRFRGQVLREEAWSRDFDHFNSILFALSVFVCVFECWTG